MAEPTLLEELNRRLTREKAKTRKAAVNTAIVENAVAEALAQMPRTIKAPPKPKRKTCKRREIALLHLSDTQIGKVTDSYNAEVAEARIMKCIERTIRIAQVRSNGAAVDEIHVALGGDMVEGELIFPHQAHLIEQCVFDQAIHTAPRILVTAILALLREFRKVKVFGVAGNHGRTGPKSSAAHPRSNWDRVLYTTLRNILVGSPDNPRTDPYVDRLEVVVPESFYYVDKIYNWGCLHVHGHQIRGGSGGFPVAGVAKKAFGWIDSVPDPWDYLYFGHFHQYTSGTINHRQFFCNGTTESGSDYVQEYLAASGTAVQRLQFFDSEHGMIADNPIFLEQKTPRK